MVEKIKVKLKPEGVHLLTAQKIDVTAITLSQNRRLFSYF